MTINKELEADIRRLYFVEQWKIGTITCQLGVHQDVVKRVIGKNDTQKSVRKTRKRLIDPVAEFIQKTLETYPTLRATRLYDMVRPRGYKGSARTLRSYVQQVRPAQKQSKAYFKIESLIGEQAQVDWGHAGNIYVSNTRRPLWLFVIVLSWSRAIWGEFVFELTAESLHRSLVRAMGYFGGSPRQWLFDNAKSVVIERHGSSVRFHPQLLDLASHYCVQVHACAPRTPEHKGKVERSIRYIRDRFLSGRVIANIDQANEAFLVFIEDITNQRRHPVHREMTVGECLQQERKHLIELPAVEPNTDLIKPVVVSKDCFVRFDTNRYLVPPQLANKTVSLVVNDKQIRIVDGEKEKAIFERCWGKRQEIKLPKYIKLIEDERRSQAPSIGQDRLLVAAPQISILFERWLEMGRNVGSLTATTLKLLDLYGTEIFAESVRDAVSRGTHDPGALALVCEKLRHDKKRKIQIPVNFGSHVPDQDVIPHALEKYDDESK